jgi:hypothetical protein
VPLQHYEQVQPQIPDRLKGQNGEISPFFWPDCLILNKMISKKPGNSPFYLPACASFGHVHSKIGPVMKSS